MTHALSEIGRFNSSAQALTRRRSVDRYVFLFWILLIIQLIPLWISRYIPTTDGPSHVYNAIVLRDYNRPDRPGFRTFFEHNDRPVPNWIAPLTLLGLCTVAPPLIAEKIMLSAYLIGFVLAMRWEMSAVRPRGGRLAIAAFPMAASFYFYEGLYSFYFGIIVFLIVIGFWIREERRPTRLKTALLSGLLVLLYFSHPMPLGMAYLFIGETIVWRIWLARSNPDALQKARAAFWRNCLAAAPSFALLASFVLTEHSSRAAEEFMRHPHGWFYRLRNLISWMKSYQLVELGPASVVMCMIVAVTAWLLWRRAHSPRPHFRKLHAFDAPFFIAALYLALFLGTPSKLGGGGAGIVMRLAGFPFFAILIWWSTQPICRRARQRLEATVAIVSTLALISMVVLHARSSARLTPYLEEIENAEAQIPIGATMLPIVFSGGADVDSSGRRLSWGTSPLVEATDYFAGQRGIVDLDNYEAALDYFPLRFRPAVDPYTYIIDSGWHFANYRKRTGQTVDYVLLWTGGVEGTDRTTRFISQQLAGGYDLVFVSDHSHYTRLYRRRSG